MAASLFYATLLEWLRSNGDSQIASDSFVVFGLAALALLVVAPFLARAAPAPGSGQQQLAPSSPPADR